MENTSSFQRNIAVTERKSYKYIHIFEYLSVKAMKETDSTLFQLHAEICRTLSNSKRLMILNSLRDGEKSVSQLAKLVNARQANISQHLAILRQRGIVTTRRQGANVYYSVANPKIIQACDLIREVLFEQLTRAKELTEKHSEKR